MSEPMKYRKKPVVIEGERLNGTLDAVREFTQKQRDEIRGRYRETGGAPARYLGFADACGDILAVIDEAVTDD